MRPATDEHLAAHKHSSLHREEILSSTKCGCFYCFGIFAPSEIVEWVDAPPGQQHAEMSAFGRTAICPKCGIDSVIGDKSGYPLDDAFLNRMHSHWFKS